MKRRKREEGQEDREWITCEDRDTSKINLLTIAELKWPS